MELKNVRVADVKVGDRFRKNLNNIPSLADSIRNLGLLQPIGIRKDRTLIFGARRLEAFKVIGKKTIPAAVCETLTEEMQLLEAERDENTEREPFTPAEALALQRRLEPKYKELGDIEKEKGAKKGGETAGKGRPKDSPSTNNTRAKQDNSKRTKQQAAASTGYSASTLSKVAEIKDAGEGYEELAAKLDDKDCAVDRVYKEFKSEQRRRKKRAELETKAAEAKPEKPAWRIILGNCIEELPKLTKARLVFADPPYNIGIEYGAHNDLQAEHDYYAWCEEWMALCVNTLTNDGSMWVMINDEWADQFALMLTELGLHRRAWIKWYETFGVNCSNNFNRTSRHIFYYVVDPNDFIFNTDVVRRPSDRQTKYNDSRANPDGKILDDVWQVPRLTGTCAERLPDFPTQLPVEILRRIVGCATNPGDLVLDPFNGSGTTGHAALSQGRRYIGIELEEKFWELATLRLSGI